MKKVLIVAYAFPPIGGVGVLRVVKFVKYLPAFGWEPVILTVDQGADFVYDESLRDDLPAATQVHRARSWEPFSVTRAKRTADRLSTSSQNGARGRVKQLLKSLYFTLRVPDDKLGWLPFATKLGKQVMQQQAIDLIFATAPPYTNLLVGRALKKASGKPLVADYRDEWTGMRYRDTPSNFFNRFANGRLERSVLKLTDGIITAAQPIADNLRKSGLLTAQTLQTTIMNGFDPDDYVGYKSDAKNAKFTIVYTGSFYGERQTPKYFLQALAQLFQEQPALRAHFQVYFVGSIYASHTRFIDELGLGDVVQVCGVLPHQQAVQYQVTADALLLVVGKGAGSDVVLTGKIFEYLGAGRPILGLVPLDGPAADLIRRSATGVTIDPEDVAGIRAAIAKLYADWAGSHAYYQPNMDVVNQYNRRVLTQQLVTVFEQVLATA